MSEKPVPPESQNFRRFIWEGKSETGTKLHKSLLNRRRVNAIDKGDSTTVTRIELTLDEEKITRSYIYVDSAKPVLNGGFYYAIDLSLFISTPDAEGTNMALHSTLVCRASELQR